MITTVKELPFQPVYNELTAICNASQVHLLSPENRHYGKDETMDKEYSFDILVKPDSSEQIADILKVCTKHNMPLTVRGGGTGVTGGALPVNGGVVLSMEKLNKVIKIDKTDRIAVVEAGVISANLHKEVEANGMYFPIQPGSSGSCQIGGNVSENSGSINSCKYGVMADYVLNLEVVLPSGEIIWTGTDMRKDTAGLNLTQLFTGSEGILGIITKVVLRLIPKPSTEIHLLAGLESIESAIALCHAIRQSDVEPSAVELLDREAILLCEEHYGYSMFPDHANQAHLIIKLEGHSEDYIFSLVEQINSLSQDIIKEPILIGRSTEEVNKIWAFRKGLGGILNTGNRFYRDIDAAVPLSRLGEYVLHIDVLAKKYECNIVKFGHIIDGNLHTMLILEKGNEASSEEELVRDMFREANRLGGTITGEHGIGLIQKQFLQSQIGNVKYNILLQLKKLFDPGNVLNSGKVIA